jgi:hypothetical protein
VKTANVITNTLTYSSEVVPEVSTTSGVLAEAIAWADANPVVWKIVMGTKSKAFGKNSNEYMGCQRGDAPQAALARAARFKSLVEGQEPDRYGFWQWRARFTLEHYNDKGFTSGYFQQFDGTYNRGCCTLDYTPKTREAAIDQFAKWCDSGPCRYETASISIDYKVVRVVKAAAHG